MLLENKTKEFSDALVSGVLAKAFTINGENFFMFAKDGMELPMARWIIMINTAKAYNDYGMSIPIAKDYITDAHDSFDKILKTNDIDEIREIAMQGFLSTGVHKDHVSNISMIGLMLECCAMSFICEGENPYVVDYVLNTKKIDLWQASMTSEGGEDFMSFFTSFTLNKCLDWIRPLMLYVQSYQISEMEMTEEMMKTKKTREQALSYQVSRSLSHLKEWRGDTSSSDHVQPLRTILNLAKLRLNDSISSILSRISE